MGYQHNANLRVAAQQWTAAPSPTGQPHCVLVIDDDAGVKSTIAEFFERNGFSARTGSGLNDMSRHLAGGDVDLITLDLRLGRENGLDLLRHLRSRSSVPVIITTGLGHEAIDRVIGLELGADDYVTKPFSLHELLARANAILRRTGPACNRSKRNRECRFAGWHLDRTARRLTDPDGKPVTLTKGEHSLLVAFLDAPQRPLSREHLLQATRVHEDVFDRSIDVQILRLRRKLKHRSGDPCLIKTERGLGYVFTASVEHGRGPERRA